MNGKIRAAPKRTSRDEGGREKESSTRAREATLIAFSIDCSYFSGLGVAAKGSAVTGLSVFLLLDLSFFLSSLGSPDSHSLTVSLCYKEAVLPSDLFFIAFSVFHPGRKKTTLYMSYYVAPSQQRTLRACMVCSLVQLHNVRFLSLTWQSLFSALVSSHHR